MRSSLSVVTLMFVLATGCVSERPSGDDDDDGGGSGSGSAIDPDWLASGPVGTLATDSTHLYFAGQGGTLMRVPLAGGTPETLYTMPPITEGFGGVEAIYPAGNDIVFVTQVTDYQTSTTKSLLVVPKAGGAALELSTSQDSRSYLGVTIAGSNVYFSSFTSLLRVPLSGGAVTFVGESPNSVQYWALSPTIVGTDLYWAEGGELYRIPSTATHGEGVMFAELTAAPSIVGTTATSFVTALAPDLYDWPTQIAMVDRATGQVGAPVALGDQANQLVVVGNDVYAATFDGVVRVALGGGAVEHLTTESSMYVAATPDAVFVPNMTGITRIAL
jgi:hypothetical protein